MRCQEYIKAPPRVVITGELNPGIQDFAREIILIKDIFKCIIIADAIFLASANFWEKHAKNCAIMSILDYFWSILDLLFGANFWGGELVGANSYAFCNYDQGLPFFLAILVLHCIF